MGFYPHLFKIYSNSYNNHNISKKPIYYFGIAEILCKDAELDTPLFNSIVSINRREYRDKKMKQFETQYGEYLFTESELPRYNNVIKAIDLKIDDARRNNDKEKVSKLIKSKEKYKFVKTEKELHLHNIAKNIDFTLEWVKVLRDYKNKDSNNKKLNKEVYDYIKNRLDENTIFYHSLVNILSDEEKRKRDAERIRKWKKENPEKAKQCTKNYFKDPANKEKINATMRKCLYKKKLKPHFTDEEIDKHEKTIIEIVENNNKKNCVNKLADMINENKAYHIIIKHILNEDFDYNKINITENHLSKEFSKLSNDYRKSLSKRLTYLKKLNHQ